MQEEENKQNNKPTRKLNINIKGIDIDKNEYQEIILSNSNHPDSISGRNLKNY